MERWDELNARGQALLDEQRLDEAEMLFRSATEAAPDRPEPWYNLGLAHKWRHRWEDCLLANRRSAELAHELGFGLEEDPACWNLGIAASAVRAWDLARWAWRSYGIPVPDGDGPPDGNFGPGYVRINPGGDGEVVFGQRLDPARLRIDCVPTPESGHRFGDVVLHDGEPKGRRILDGRSFAVFDELERLQPSPIPTSSVEVWCSEPADVEALLAAAHAAGGAEDWTASFQIICRACSESDAGVEHDHDRLHTEWDPQRRIGLAVPAADVEPLVERWVAASPADRVVHALHTA